MAAPAPTPTPLTPASLRLLRDRAWHHALLAECEVVCDLDEKTPRPYMERWDDVQHEYLEYMTEHYALPYNDLSGMGAFIARTDERLWNRFGFSIEDPGDFESMGTWVGRNAVLLYRLFPSNMNIILRSLSTRWLDILWRLVRRGATSEQHRRDQAMDFASLAPLYKAIQAEKDRRQAYGRYVQSRFAAWVESGVHHWGRMPNDVQSIIGSFLDPERIGARRGAMGEGAPVFKPHPPYRLP